MVGIIFTSILNLKTPSSSSAGVEIRVIRKATIRWGVKPEPGGPRLVRKLSSAEVS